MSNITFNVSKKWWDLYKSGLKRKEFRAITAHWVKRLMSDDRTSRFVDLTYAKVAWELGRGFTPQQLQWKSKTYETVTICLGYPAKDDISRRMTFKWKSTSIGFAEAGIGKELLGDERVFVIEMEDL